MPKVETGVCEYSGKLVPMIQGRKKNKKQEAIESTSELL
jgi:hypothetical protein